MNISVEQAKKFLPVPVELFSMVEEEMRAIESNTSDDYIELDREIEFIWNGAQNSTNPSLLLLYVQFVDGIMNKATIKRIFNSSMLNENSKAGQQNICNYLIKRHLLIA